MGVRTRKGKEKIQLSVDKLFISKDTRRAAMQTKISNPKNTFSRIIQLHSLVLNTEIKPYFPLES